VPPSPVLLTRRQGLVALVIGLPAAALAACTSAPDGGDEPTSDPQPTPGSASATSEAQLIAQYEAALAATPEAEAQTRSLLAQIRDQHRAHLDALGGAPEASAPSPPASGQDAVADLVTAERAAYRERLGACVDATDLDLARVLALIAASEAAHVPALRSLAGGGAS
jgi:hypothetical protein